MAQPGAPLEIRRVRAVVNPLSGSVDAGAADALRTLLAGRFDDVEVVEVQPQEIGDKLRAALAEKPDLLILLAGDGTIGMAATLAGPEGPLLAPLPGGTMNMLPHAIYGDVPWREALAKALDGGAARDISGGEIDGQRFYVAAILGAPALWAPAREAVRQGKLWLAYLRALRALKRAFQGHLRFSLDGGERQKSEALVLMCPLVSRALQRDDVLEATALNPKGAADAFRLGAATLLGDWRSDPSVHMETCRSGAAWARGRIPASLDGEPHRFDNDAPITFVPKAFRALAPDAPQPAAVDKDAERAAVAGAAASAAAEGGRP